MKLWKRFIKFALKLFGKKFNQNFAQAFPKLESLLTIFCLLCVFIIPAESRDAGTSGSAVLRIGIGARATGMGEASVALADDVSSIYWNPAGLFQVRNSQLSMMHLEWLDDVRYEWLAYVQPVASWGTLAADISYAYMGSIPRTIESPTEGYEQDGTFTMSDMAGRLAFGGRLHKNLLAGASVQMLRSKADFQNVIREWIGDKIAQSTAISLGCLYNTPVPELTVGCSFQNIGRQTRAFVSEADPMPFIFRMGAAYRVHRSKTRNFEKVPSDLLKLSQSLTEEQPAEIEEGAENAPQAVRRDSQSANSEKPPNVLTLAMDLDFAVDDSISARMGVEYRFGIGLAIRGGYRTGTGFDFPSGLCGGIGYSTSTYQLDYALVPYGDIGNTHRVSFTVRF